MNSTLAVHRGSLFEIAFPHSHLLTKVILVISGSWLMAIASHWALPLPFTPVPVTGQTFAVLLLASILGRRLALATQLVYLAQGLAGLPVFAPGTTWGLARVLGPTGGYLIGFSVATWLVGWFADRGFGKKFVSSVAIMILGEMAIYLLALPWLKTVMRVSWSRTLEFGLWPFLLGDIYKVILAALLLPLSWRLVQRLRRNPI